MAGPWDKLIHKIVDTHCHVHHYKDALTTARKISDAGIKVHCVTVKPSEFEACKKLFKDFPNIIPCIGLFPLNVKEEYKNLELFFKHLQETRFVGEIGLDYSVSDKIELNLQNEVFESIIETCNKAGNKILSIHSRRSAEEVLKFLGQDFNGVAIMHWFSGQEDLVKKSPENIFYSVNSAMVKSRQGKKILQSLRPQQVLTETDGPYVSINNQPAVPADIRNTVNSLSSIWDLSLEKTMEILVSNYQKAVRES